MVCVEQLERMEDDMTFRSSIGEKGLSGTFRPNVRELALFEVSWPLAAILAMTLQSLLGEMTAGTVMLAAFPPEGIEPMESLLQMWQLLVGHLHTLTDDRNKVQVGPLGL